MVDLEFDVSFLQKASVNKKRFPSGCQRVPLRYFQWADWAQIWPRWTLGEIIPLHPGNFGNSHSTVGNTKISRILEKIFQDFQNFQDPGKKWHLSSIFYNGETFFIFKNYLTPNGFLSFFGTKDILGCYYTWNNNIFYHSTLNEVFFAALFKISRILEILEKNLVSPKYFSKISRILENFSYLIE